MCGDRFFRISSYKPGSIIEFQIKCIRLVLSDVIVIRQKNINLDLTISLFWKLSV